MKDDGGIVDLTENLAALRRRMVSGPEMATVIGKLEASIEYITLCQPCSSL